MPATCGLPREELSSSPAPGSSSSKTSRACSRRGMTTSLAPSASSETYADLVLRLRSDYSARQKRAQAINATGFSSSRWPTMRAGDGPSHQLRENVTDARGRLEDVLANWPTPTARDWKDTGDMTNVPENALLGRVAMNWSTPRSSDGEKGGPNQSFGAGGIPLPAQASQWMTPRVSETGQYQYNKGNKDDPVLTLQGQAQIWATPSVADTTGGRMTRSGDRSSEMLLKGQAALLSDLWATPRVGETDESWETKRARNARHLATSESSSRTKGVGGPTVTMQAVSLRSILPDHPISTVGEESSKIRRTLNPLFVEWLMGWPPGWTFLALTPPASNDCACSATALSAWKRRMRSALYALGLPPPARPPQLTLFG
jgi:hypothetical protein